MTGGPFGRRRGQELVPGRDVEHPIEQGLEALDLGDGLDFGQGPLIRLAQPLAAQAEEDLPRLLGLTFGLTLGEDILVDPGFLDQIGLD